MPRPNPRTTCDRVGLANELPTQYVSHSGLIRLARRKRCAGIHVEPVAQSSDPASSRWAFKATVLSRLNAGVSLAMAMPIHGMYLPWSTARKCGWPKRADNRALRKAYGNGTGSVEEIGSLQDRPRPPGRRRRSHPSRSMAKTGTTTAPKFTTASAS